MGIKIALGPEYDAGPTYGKQRNHTFNCPACGTTHSYAVPRWAWNGSLDRPTYSPSLLRFHQLEENGPRIVDCHLFVTDGKIIYCGDNPHSMNGQTVDMPDWDPERLAMFET